MTSSAESSPSPLSEEEEEEEEDLAEEAAEEETTLVLAAVVDANVASIAYWLRAAATTPAPLDTGRGDEADAPPGTNSEAPVPSKGRWMGTTWPWIGRPGNGATSGVASAMGMLGTSMETSMETSMGAATATAAKAA